MLENFDVLKIRNDFPELSRTVHDRPLIYLDNAASTLKCRPVIDALNAHYSNEAANIHRGVHYLSEMGTIKYEETRKSIQHLINARNDYEVIFTKGTTESLNLVASSYGRKFLKKGDQILLSTLEHHSNIVPWQMIAEEVGAEVIEIPVNDLGEIDLTAYKILLNEKVAIVATNHISNSLGTINPIAEMIKLAHDVGAIYVVDAAQSISHEKIDVQNLDCDFLAFSSHKMFGPTGVGVLYGKEDLLNEMPPYQGGGDMIDVVSFEKTTYNTLPHKFEAGTPHIAGVIALKAAIDYINEIGLDTIKAWEHELLEYATEQLSKIDGLKIIGTSKEKTSVISFTMEGAHPHDIGTLLDRQGIAVRTGHHCTQPLMKRFNIPATTRASFSVYNTKEEVDALVAAIIKTKEFL
ncbi:cysteine sulfinate desulfinase [Halobacteriovorax marinus]|uniref:Cysteine desulfurase n=1 Tax=Halobacteriovorax marinus (strain ATCC BAA-682 / DSM 15412 / SJ) TaxID=862908 RepID=E1WZ18_HALMS|nr:cysteine desulfurase [Halobacteriovorax marinus]ATH07489.1 cysteine sulfinate desulfinase [Halobacteriovorax marinus]CBW26115.1 putative aminotransferase [Halobacteriovorax marinus SJ]